MERAKSEFESGGEGVPMYVCSYFEDYSSDDKGMQDAGGGSHGLMGRPPGCRLD